jgi:hypothetical protein
MEGFHPWDAIASMYLTDPDLFETRERILLSGVEELSSGLLRTAPPLAPASATPWATPRATPSSDGASSGAPIAEGPRINLPTRLRDPEALHDRLFEAWDRLGARLEARGGSFR